MVARIRTGKSIKGAINYNEKKLKIGNAKLIMAEGYLKELNDLTFHDKLIRLERLADLNERAKTNCLHVSLNFDPKEKLSEDTLRGISKVYMNKIGFGSQPFLVYLHRDAAHQHIHIVTTNIRKDGKRISMHNLGRNESESARKEIEIKFNLKKASNSQRSCVPEIKPANIEKAIYGKFETKRSILKVVTQVIEQYKFTSLNEFNAVLRHFNVIADPGQEGSRMFRYRGLQYSLLDNNGNKIGVPIRASSLTGSPTLPNLEVRFAVNAEMRKPHAQNLKIRIDHIISKSRSNDLDSLIKALKNNKIILVPSINENKFLFGVIYLDHNTKTVFKGSDLGKEYGATAIRKLLNPSNENLNVQIGNEDKITREPFFNDQLKSPHEGLANIQTHPSPEILQTIIDPVPLNDFIPWQLKKKRKKKI
jgi:hypothetical protein